ncbi:hypothetical protein C0Q70_17404 [Pomacea canaliculata]|uniref:Reverse transcriptase domain-containing protein n=1 Tax=Pomacea canaliculata TaxID=400727 RepID=A0A2T7NKB6_POMCA|nr:hypothetical protein C0Q70_17404 [Pomacea canaliculata]
MADCNTNSTGAAGEESIVEKLLRQLEELRSEIVRNKATRPIQVQLLPPAPLPELRTFTGLLHTSPQEVTFEQWRVQALEVQDDALMEEKVGFLRRSLKGAAHVHTKDKQYGAVSELVAHLQALFGWLQTADDIYIELCQMRPTREQCLSQFLLQLSTKMSVLKTLGGLTEEECNRRLYYIFSKGISEPMVAMEVWNKFGIPGVGRPTFPELYCHVRQVESLISKCDSSSERSERDTKARTEVRVTHVQQDRPVRKVRRSKYCFKCGEEGHFYRECNNPVNAALVVQRERAAETGKQVAKNTGPPRRERQHHRGASAGARGQQTVELCGTLTTTLNAPVTITARSQEWLPENITVVSASITGSRGHVAVRNSSSRRHVTLTSRVVLAELHSPGADHTNLEALVGPSCESPIRIDGVTSRCLIDSGSQKYATSTAGKLDSTLQVIGAGGHSVPYIGVVRVSVWLPKDVVGVDSKVDTLLLVCPDTEYSSRVPVIAGTNILRAYARQCERVAGRNFTTRLPLCGMIAHAYREATSAPNGRLCPVRLLTPDTTLPPRSVTDVRGIVRHGVNINKDAVLIQEPTVEALPDGVCVLSGKVSTNTLLRIRVTLLNTTDSPVTIRRKSVIADLFTIQSEYSLPSVLQDLNCDTQDVTCKTHCHANHVEEDVVHDIELTPGPSIRERPRPIPPQDLEEVRQHVQQLLDARIIKPSTSSFASPIVLVRKKNGALRMCVDYRRVNARTVRDSYSLPKIEQLFLTLSGAKVFTSLDLSKAYYQVPLSERAKKISAFTTPFGLYEFQRLPFGLVNAPMTFQRLMDCCLSDMNLAELIIFLDDILIHGTNLQQLDDRTIKALERLRSFKLKLDPDKCIFATTEVRHLGYLISAEGIRPDPEKIEALTSWPVPTTVRDVKAFLGFAGFYRRWVPQFAQIAKPVNDLTIGYVPHKLKKTAKKAGALNLSSDISHLWGEREQSAFESLIKALTAEPMLGIADQSQPFILHCDAMADLSNDHDPTARWGQIISVARQFLPVIDVVRCERAKWFTPRQQLRPRDGKTNDTCRKRAATPRRDLNPVKLLLPVLVTGANWPRHSCQVHRGQRGKFGQKQ